MKINRMVSLVVPVYNEEDNLRHFYRSVRDVMDKLPYHWELIFVDDGSSDSSRTMLAEMEVQDERVRAIFLARNYGHQTALTCGLDHADGEAVISMDGDMQHPPELLPRLLELWEQGFDVVQAIRKATADAGFMKRLTSAGYYRLLNMITSVPIREGGSDFRLLDREAVLALRQHREHARFLRGLVSSLGFRQTIFEFTAPPRFAGHSKYSLRKMLRLAMDGVFTCSAFPLRLGLYAGMTSAMFAVLLILYVLYETFVAQNGVSGWPAIVACFAFFGGLQLMLMGVMGEYVARIYDEAKQRPLYLVQEYGHISDRRKRRVSNDEATEIKCSKSGECKR